MILLSTIINKFKDAFFAKYQSSVLPSHQKALWSMAKCRTEHSLHMLARCADHECGTEIYVPHSCGHRNCPHCQNHETSSWIEKQLNKRLPAPCFLITFTLPAQLRDLARRNQKTVYSLMFASVKDTLKTFTANDRKLGGEAGFTAILHTHARNLDHHPHIHVVMPGASINKKTGLWKKKSSNYLFNHKALAKVFRAKMLTSMVEQDLRLQRIARKNGLSTADSERRETFEDVGNGDKAIIYLGKYLYRGVIQEKDILKCEDGMVTFRYLHAKTGKYRTREVSGEKFLYLLMLHVLPKGFRRTRCYGFLHPCSKKLIRFLQLVLRVNPFTLFNAEQPKKAAITCPNCGKEMKIIRVRVRKPPPLRPAVCIA